MGEKARSAAIKAVALIVLAVAAWIVLKLVLNVVTVLAWAVAAVFALVAVIWAVTTLRSSR